VPYLLLLLLLLLLLYHFLQCLMLALDAPLLPNIPAAAALLAQGGSGSRRGLLQRHRCVTFGVTFSVVLVFKCFDQKL
jgi:hypothetical protein